MPSRVFVTSSIAARNAGSSVVVVLDWTRTNSTCSSAFFGKASSMILSAVRASPTFSSLSSRYLVPTAPPMTTAAITNASQPKVAVFQWLALQRPIRAARLFERFKGVISGVSPRYGWVDGGSHRGHAATVRRPCVWKCGLPHAGGRLSAGRGELAEVRLDLRGEVRGCRRLALKPVHGGVERAQELVPLQR